jgi:hypothetical protein
VIATVYAAAATTSVGNYLIGAGNIKLKSGATVVSSNQFDIGSYRDIYPLRASLIYLDTPTSDSQTYSVEITNDSTIAHNCFAEIIAFDVTDAAFLDTDSVAVGTSSQTTVGNLSTTLSGDVAVIALAAAESTAASDGTIFEKNGVVLQRDNSSTGQVSNLVVWYIFSTSSNARSGVLPLFRYDTGVTNPSYQVKMKFLTQGGNCEAKILAFTMAAGQQFTVSLSETLTASDALAGIPNYVRVLAETLTASDSLSRLQTLARTITQTLTASDTLARIPRYIRLIAETLTASDTLARQQALTRLVTESLTGSDTITGLRGYVRNIAETLTASDDITRAAAYVRTIAESVGITSTAFPGAALIALAETILIADSLQVIRIPFQPTPPPGPPGPPAEIPLPTPQQVFPIGLAVALGVVFAGAVYGVQRRRSMGAVMARATQRRPRLRGFRLGMRRWKAGKMPRRRRWRDSLGE